MDFVKGLQRAIDYIENHLTDEIAYERIAQQAACSTFYFQRIFSVLCVMSVGDYIRKRRLTLAAYELQKGQEKIIDLTVKYGYSSADSFTRAYSKQHGVLPTEVSEETQLKAQVS